MYWASVLRACRRFGRADATTGAVMRILGDQVLFCLPGSGIGVSTEHLLNARYACPSSGCMRSVALGGDAARVARRDASYLVRPLGMRLRYFLCRQLASAAISALVLRSFIIFEEIQRSRSSVSPMQPLRTKKTCTSFQRTLLFSVWTQPNDSKFHLLYGPLLQFILLAGP